MNQTGVSYRNGATPDMQSQGESRRRATILIGIVIILLILGAVTVASGMILRSKTSSESIPASSMLTPAPLIEPSHTQDQSVKGNPLIRPEDQEKIDSANRKLREENNIPSPTPVDAQYEFKLAPELQGGLYNPFIRRAHAAGCSEITAPPVVDVYTLKTNILDSEAQQLATEFGIRSPAYSQPGPYGTFVFFFYDPTKNGDYITVSQANGSLVSHKILSTFSAPIDRSDADGIVASLLSAHPLLHDSVQYDVIERGTQSAAYTYKFVKRWGSYPVVSIQSLDGIGQEESLCEIESARDVNNLQIDLATDGQVSNIVSRYKVLKSIRKLPTIDLATSMREYPQAGLTPFFANGAHPDKFNSITITEAKLVYYDIGDLPQCTYVPMYATSGLSSTNTRVYALFPAVRAEDIADACGVSTSGVIQSDDNSASSLQYTTYVIPTPTPTPPPAPPGGTGRCWGNQVDYIVDCRGANSVSCSVFLGVPYADQSSDPFNVCTQGPLVPPITKSIINGSYAIDVCRTMFEKVNEDLIRQNKQPIPLASYQQHQTFFPEGLTECTMQVNPC